MTPQNADRRRPAGGGVDEDCTPSIAHEGDHLPCPECYGAGIRDGHSIGHAEGYAEGDRDGYERGCPQREFDLAAADPGYHVDRGLEWLPPFDALQLSRRAYRGLDRQPARAQTPEQIAARAAYSGRRAEREIAEQQGQRAG